MTQALIDPQQRRDGRSEWPSRDDPHARKRMANEYMRGGLRRLDPNEPIPFFCECDEPDCFATVWLKGVTFDRIRGKRDGRVLIAGHAAAAAA